VAADYAMLGKVQKGLSIQNTKVSFTGCGNPLKAGNLLFYRDRDDPYEIGYEDIQSFK
jgi:hypothetical protein